jgi:hypothetical protein
MKRSPSSIFFIPYEQLKSRQGTPYGYCCSLPLTLHSSLLSSPFFYNIFLDMLQEEIFISEARMVLICQKK